MKSNVRCILCGAEGVVDLFFQPKVVLCELCKDTLIWNKTDENHAKEMWNRFFYF